MTATRTARVHVGRGSRAFPSGSGHQVGPMAGGNHSSALTVRVLLPAGRTARRRRWSAERAGDPVHPEAEHRTANTIDERPPAPPPGHQKPIWPPHSPGTLRCPAFPPQASELHIDPVRAETISHGTPFVWDES